MKISDLTILICPSCDNGKIKFSVNYPTIKLETIEEGFTTCQICDKNYVIKNGIPRFVSNFNYSNSFGYQWHQHYKTQLDSNSKLSISKDRLLEVTGWTLDEIEDSIIVEAGSGAGRFTEVLLNAGAYVISFDFSNAVDVIKKNLSNIDSRLLLFQGDIMRIPLRKRNYSKVICLGVLQHTENPYKAFIELSSLVAPNGEIVIDIYKKTFSSLLQWKYLLRPLTKRLSKESLYSLINVIVPILLPLAAKLRKVAGRFGARLLPICDYSHLGLSDDLNKEWSILDTFDMYSPKYDKPRTKKTILKWFKDAELDVISVRYGLNGIVAKGKYKNNKH